MGEQMPSPLGEWISKINEALHTNFELGEDGRLVLKFENGVTVGVEMDIGEGFYTLYAPLIALHSPSDLPLVTEALRLNLYQKGTAGGVIGLEPTMGMLIYSFRFPIAQSSADILAGHLEQFSVATKQVLAILEAARSGATGVDERIMDISHWADRSEKSEQSEIEAFAEPRLPRTTTDWTRA